MILPEAFFKSVCALSHKEDDVWQSHGTGFFFAAQRKNTRGEPFERIFLVTNKHNLCHNGTNIPWIYLSTDIIGNTVKAGRLELNLKNEDNSPTWTSLDDVDVAVTQIPHSEFQTLNLDVVPFHGDAHCWTLQQMEENGCFEGEQVLVLGFPFDVHENLKNYPVVRSGIISRLKDTYANSKPSFLIEAHVTVGNSGSPVILLPSQFHITGTAAPQKAQVLGVVSDFLLTSFRENDQAVKDHTGLSTVWTIDVVDQLVDEHLSRYPKLVPE